jgi:hypothetical protein
MVLNGKLATDELHCKNEAEKAHIQQKTKGNKQIQKYGVIYTSDAQLCITVRDEREAVEEERKAALLIAQEVAQVHKQLDATAHALAKAIQRSDIAAHHAEERVAIKA